MCCYGCGYGYGCGYARVYILLKYKIRIYKIRMGNKCPKIY